MPKKPKKPRGRPRKQKIKRGPGRPKVCMPFEEAVKIVRAENIQSFRDYQLWWTFHAPARLPKRPDRAYHKEWKGWGYYLGNWNEPVPRYPVKRFRPYEDAKAFAHKLRFRSVTEWHAYAKSGKKPDDIPARPDVHYRKAGDWITWSDFLGTKISHKLKELQKQKYLYVGRLPNDSRIDVFSIGVTTSPYNLIKDEEIRLVKLYELDPDFDWVQFVEKHSKPFLDRNRENERILHNVGNFISEISFLLTETNVQELLPDD